MKNVFLVPTDKPSRLVKFFSSKYHLCKEILPIQDEEQYQNIYITNDEEIKEGGWFIHYSHEIITLLKAFKVEDRILDNQGTSCNIDYCKKIILTTDQDLIKDGVQAIDDDFLEWFVKNPSCEKVELVTVNKCACGKSSYKYQCKYYAYSNISGDVCGREVLAIPYKIIIPKEELKQQTLEEATEEWYDSTEENKGFPKIKAFKAGAKWQEQRMYSEEEVYHILCEHTAELFKGSKLSLTEWFKKFKK